MKRIRAKIILMSGCMLACSFVFYSCWIRMHAVERFVYNFDAQLSEYMQREIATSIDACIGQDGDAVIADALKNFPCIADIEFQNQPNKEALLHVIAQKPFLRINEDHVLTTNARLLPLHYFKSELVEQLPGIAVCADALTDQNQLNAIAQELKDMDFAILQKFQVTWINQHELMLQDVHVPTTQLVCCAYQLADPKQIENYAGQVVQLMAERLSDIAIQAGRPGLAKLEKKSCVADVRFENQVILRGATASAIEKKGANGGKGGIQHGTSVS